MGGGFEMAHARCTNCGCYRSPVIEAPGLFDAPLPFPTIDDPFAAFHRRSREREARAVATQVVGAERRLRTTFTNNALKWRPPHD